ncbi:MAG: hypothetical protein HKO95_07795 [Rhodobacteraceae bacterium]|nr:hypothetical protein [Alphaproteobacteria bacterium]NNK66623.1 hypothetical protein [Paracoccaceae bacterium]
MSANNTNLEKQTRRHRPALIGIAASVGVAAVMFFIFLTYATDPDDTPFDVNQAAPATSD